MATKNASDIMTENPACCTPDTTAQEAARMMEENDCGSLPVVESRDSMKLPRDRHRPRPRPARPRPRPSRRAPRSARP